MTVHCVRLHAEPPKGDAENAVDNWITNFSRWTGGAEQPLGETQTQETETAFVAGGWYFVDNDEDRQNVIISLSDELATFQSGLWHYAAYSASNHDLEARGGDSWQYLVDSENRSTDAKTVPSEIPRFAPEATGVTP